MKTLIMMALFLVSLTAFSAEISPKALGAIEARIELQKELLKDKKSNLDITDITEGKIVAAIISTVEIHLQSASAELESIDTDEKLTEEKIQEINDLLDESEALIESI